MIFPLLNGILGFSKAPATWGLFFINLLFLIMSMEQPKSFELNMKKLFDDKYFVATQTNLYLDYMGKNQYLYGDLHKNLYKKAKSGSKDQIEILGQLAFKDKKFIDWALATKPYADVVAFEYWQENIKEILYLQKTNMSYKMGVSLNDFSFARWFSYQFIHSGFMHFFGNMIFLLIFGCALEPVIGVFGFLLAYLGSGILGAGVFLLFSGPSVAPLVGASGAVSGIMALFALLYAHRKVKFIWFVGFSESLSGVVYLPAWISFFMWLVSDLAGFISSSEELGGIAYSAHLGGEMTGAIIGIILFFTRYGNWDDLFAHQDESSATKTIG